MMVSKTVYNCLQCLGEFSTEKAIVFHIKSRHQVSEVNKDMYCVSTHEVITNTGLKGSSLRKSGDKLLGVSGIGNKKKQTSFFGDMMEAFNDPGKMEKLPLFHKVKPKDKQQPSNSTSDHIVVLNPPIESKERKHLKFLKDPPSFKVPMKKPKNTETSNNRTVIDPTARSPPSSSCLSPSPEPVLTPPPVCSPVRKFKIRMSPPRLKSRKKCGDPDCRPCSREEDCFVCSHCTNKSLKYVHSVHFTLRLTRTIKVLVNYNPG